MSGPAALRPSFTACSDVSRFSPYSRLVPLSVASASAGTAWLATRPGGINSTARERRLSSIHHHLHLPTYSTSPIEVEHGASRQRPLAEIWPALSLTPALQRFPGYPRVLGGPGFAYRRHHRLPMTGPKAPGPSVWRRLATVSAAARLCCLW